LWIDRPDGSRLTLTEQDGLPGIRVHAVARDEAGRLWVGTGDGLAVVQDEKVTAVYTHANSDLPEGEVGHVFVARDGAIWIGMELGTIGRRRLDDGHWDFWTRGAPFEGEPEVNGFAETPDGAIWAAMDTGLFRYAGEQWERIGGDDLFGAVSVRAAPDGALWVSVYDSGVVRIQGEQLTRFTTADGLCHNHVRAILALPDGALWFATVTGISRYGP
jgi:ligand-binding sensor domain-containing protein